ncbi:hypothetical protein CJP74_03805 [Psittacicella melopsittaci]|uniref:Uncharacterized protein n=1 Tax=Psittacicella melopsittaci TaxID=2028576 RepID=A0A3A1Y634_9GAMM|nr:hypothetical protein [Psittacicella melopsittaci]RIY32740.1 hypothetical protein CJP74_03805 [Psittacicella melopsittaci]
MNKNTDLGPIFPPEFDLSREGDQQVYHDDYRQREREVEAFALVPFSNNAITLKASLESLAQVIKQGVLLYPELPPQVAADQSIAIATEFVANNPGYKLVKYPTPVLLPTNPWLEQNFYAGGVSLYWLYHEFLNYGLTNLKFLFDTLEVNDKAWLFIAQPDTIYLPEQLQALLSEAGEQNLNYDAFAYQTQALVVDHQSLFRNKGKIRSFLARVGLDGNEEVHYPDVVSKASLRELTSPGFLAPLAYLVRWRNLKHFTYQLDKQEDEQIKGSLGIEFAPRSQVYPESKALGYSFPYESQIVYHGYTSKELNNFYQDLAPSEVKLAEHLSKFTYPIVNRLLKHPQRQFDWNNCDYQELNKQGIYRVEEWLKGFNLRLEQGDLSQDDKYNLRAQADILQAFFNLYKVFPTGA